MKRGHGPLSCKRIETLLMRRCIFAVSVFLISAPVFAGGEKISVTGCPVPGIEAGCIVISDSVTGKFYNITAITSGSKPFDLNQNLVIQLNGTVSDEMSFCMQGPVLKEIAWDYTKMKCADAAK